LHRDETAKRDKHRGHKGNKQKSDKHKSDKPRHAKNAERDNIQHNDANDPDEDYLAEIHNAYYNNGSSFSYYGHNPPSQSYNANPYTTAHTYTGTENDPYRYPPSSSYTGHYQPGYSGYEPADYRSSVNCGPMTDPYLHDSSVAGRLTGGEHRSAGEHLYKTQRDMDETSKGLKTRKKHSKM
jgi:hypothetical protein